MKSLAIKNDIYWVGALDPNLRTFDIIMHTPFGTTYNSYVVKGSEKTCLFETVKAEFFDQYIERLESLSIDIHNIDYIVVDHTEPDHAGSVAKILELSPNASVIGSATAIKFLKAIVNKDFKSIIVNDGDEISLGNKTLKFISAPFLHWPDSMYTYIPEDKLLFTCDSFGSHYCFEDVFNDKIQNEDEYLSSLRYYFDCIIGPFKPYVLKAIDKIEGLNIDVICPGHGPILRENPWKIVNLYRTWSTPVKSDKLIVTIPYVSAYGYTEQLAKSISEGIKSAGNIEVRLFNVTHSNIEDILTSINESKGLLFGSPTILGDLLEPIRDLLAKLNPVIHGGKLAGGFGSYGWSGEAVPRIESRLKELKMEVFSPGLKVNFKPSESDLEKAHQFGFNFAEILLGNKPLSSFKNINNVYRNEKSNTNNNKKELKLWKCLVCGEIFEGYEPPEICPVCGADKDQFVEVKKEVISFSKDTSENFVIIGNGAAGFYAAKAIRERNKSCCIILISKEKISSYYRPQLSDLLSEPINEDDFYIESKKWYKENNINELLGVEVTSIDEKSNLITLSNGEKINYNKLILANGSYNFIPPTKTSKGEEINSLNYDKVKGVHTIKYLTDVESIKKDIDSSNNAVIIGGGLLGLEAANEIEKSINNVTVVEFSSRLLPRQLDLEGSKLFESIAANSKVSLMLGELCDEIIVDENNKVISIKLKSGKTLPCDLLIFSVGIRSNLDLAKSINLNSNRGIIVNNKMETSLSNIYACGDVSELNGIVYGNWPAAIEMGKVAGANAAGDNLEFKGFVSSVTFNGLDCEIFSAGTVNFDDEKLEQLSFKDILNNKYSKLFFKDSNLIGGILINNSSTAGKIITGIAEGYSKSDCINEKLI